MAKSTRTKWTWPSLLLEALLTEKDIFLFLIDYSEYQFPRFVASAYHLVWQLCFDWSLWCLSLRNLFPYPSLQGPVVNLACLCLVQILIWKPEKEEWDWFCTYPVVLFLFSKSSLRICILLTCITMYLLSWIFSLPLHYTTMPGNNSFSLGHLTLSHPTI